MNRRDDSNYLTFFDTLLLYADNERSLKSNNQIDASISSLGTNRVLRTKN